MLTNLKTILGRFRKDEEGLTLVEYGIGAILGVTVGAIALVGLGNEINNELGQADGVMERSGGGAVGSFDGVGGAAGAAEGT